MKKVIFDTSDLKKVIASFLLLKCQNSVLPVLEYMQVTCISSEGHAKVRATNLDIEIEHTINFQEPVDEDFTFITNFKKLYDLVIYTENETVTITVLENDIEVTAADGYKVTIRTHYPLEDMVKTTIPDKNEKGYLLSSMVFYSFLKEATKFVSNDELRPAMTYVNITSSGLLSAHTGTLKAMFVATDAHLLFFRKCEVIDYCGYDMLISRAIAPIMKLTMSEEPILVFKTDKHIVIRGYKTTISQRILDEKYPAWERVLLKDDIYQFYIKKKRLELLLKISTKIQSYLKRIKFFITPDKIKLLSEDIDWQNSFSAELQVLNSNQDKETTIAFNPSFFLKAISTKSEDLIKISYSGKPNNCAVINNEVLIMPIMLDNHDL